MANVFCCGFDWPGAATADLAKIFTSVGGGWTINASGRHGQCMQGNNPTITGITLTLDPQPTWALGCAVYLGTLPIDIRPLLSFNDDATNHCSLRVNPSGTVAFYRSSILLATSANALLATTWYYMEIKVTIGDAGVGNYEVRVNGTSVGWLPDTIADTRNGANASANVFGFSMMRSNYSVRFDDIYICDGVDATATQGAANNTFKGDCRVDCLIPNGNGTNSGFTGSDADQVDNYALVNDGSEATYVTADGAMIDSYAMSDIGVAVTPLMVQANIRALKTDAGACVIRPYALSGGDVAVGSDINPGTTSVIYHQIMDLDPDTAAAWTRDGLNAAEFGVERTS